jgi:hypothetical protein
MPLLGELPVGNVIAALALVSLSGAPVLLSVRGTRLRVVSRAIFLCCLVWLPASVALAGNLALNFSSWHGTLWIAVSAAVLLSALATSTWALLSALLARGVARRAA